MKWAIFSDVHGNWPALQAFTEATKGRVDRYLCLGDIVNYGPWNDECLEAIFGLAGVVVLEGNHERLFLGKEPAEMELPLVQEFLRYSRSSFTRYDLIADLPSEMRLAGYHCSHSLGNMRVYPDTLVVIKENWMIGHSHHAFQRDIEGFRLINVGSVGQNRRDIRTITYALLDDETGEVVLEERPYQWGRLLNEMRNRGYSEICLNYYLRKIPEGTNP